MAFVIANFVLWSRVRGVINCNLGVLNFYLFMELQVSNMKVKSYTA